MWKSGIHMPSCYEELMTWLYILHTGQQFDIAALFPVTFNGDRISLHVGLLHTPCSSYEA